MTYILASVGDATQTENTVSITNCILNSSNSKRQDALITIKSDEIILNGLFITDLDFLRDLEKEFSVKLKCKLVYAVDEPGMSQSYYDDSQILRVLKNKAFW